MTFDNIAEYADVANNVAAVLALLGAGLWFLYTTQFKPRLQFDIECRFLRLHQNRERVVLELQLIFENKGFVEHRLWNLNVSVHALDSEGDLATKENGELQFSKRLLPKTQLVPEKVVYYFVRPGVRQVITHIVEIPAAISVIRVTAGFDYHLNDEYPHTMRRVFHVPPDASENDAGKQAR